MKAPFDTEIIVKDGSTILASYRRTLEKPPLPGEPWTFAKGDLGGLEERYEAAGVVAKIVAGPRDTMSVEVEVKSLRPPAQRTMIVLNENLVPEERRNSIARSLLAHSSSPSVAWEASWEPHAVVRVARPDHAPETSREEWETEVQELLGSAPTSIAG